MKLAKTNIIFSKAVKMSSHNLAQWNFIDL